ncbi:hypothetical protein [Dyadobacter psychrotolerans]|uniref:hypothetical protein n=1 Tax=Dyadobacter psychrotolerans TaxID=2541721 RepID=UPI001E4B275B|nr:hypothetical protein [Dyadobacter psychrotolerans]
MEKAQASEFVLKISALWSAQKRRENLYLEALRKDSMGPLRRMLTQGHISAVLFQKEIRWIYDYFKCFMTDKDLGELSLTNSDKNLMKGIEEKEEIAGYLKKNEGRKYFSPINRWFQTWKATLKRVVYWEIIWTEFQNFMKYCPNKKGITSKVYS